MWKHSLWELCWGGWNEDGRRVSGLAGCLVCSSPRAATEARQRFSFLNEFIGIGRALGRTRDSGGLLKWDSNKSLLLCQQQQTRPLLSSLPCAIIILFRVCEVLPVSLGRWAFNR